MKKVLDSQFSAPKKVNEKLQRGKCAKKYFCQTLFVESCKDRKKIMPSVGQGCF
jgi:hypothetical protein